MATGPALIEAVRARLADAPVLRGEFEQRKSVRGFRNPLVSRGDFMVARGRGVIWRTREPFASSLALTRDRLVARSSDGTVSRTIDAREERLNVLQPRRESSKGASLCGKFKTGSLSERMYAIRPPHC
ncbi:MAG: hypothetical protein KA164_17645, partial [Rhodoferax sp.]|nr:hypothetical protein [Rhodoferax sp.]